MLAADWRLEDDADFFTVIKQVAADETNHRDVNHTFASMAQAEPFTVTSSVQNGPARLGL